MVQILVNKTTVFWFIAISLPILATSYLIGYSAGTLNGKRIVKPYEVDDSTSGRWMIIPEGWSALSIPDDETYRKPYKAVRP